MPTYTVNYGFYKPASGDGEANEQPWGEAMNANLDEIDAELAAHGSAIAGKMPAPAVPGNDWDIMTLVAGQPAWQPSPWGGARWVVTVMGSLPANRCDCGNNLPALSDGRLVLVGGQGPTAGAFTTSIYFYDIATDTWEIAPLTLPVAKGVHQTTRMADGRILIAGGYNGAAHVKTCFVLSADGASLTPVGDLGTARIDGAQVLLTTGAHAGKVMTLAGWNGARVTSTEVFDPTTLTWSAGPTTVPHTYFACCFGIFGDGRVALVGGTDNATIVWVYNPVTNTWAQGESHPHGVRQGRMVALPSGDLLLIGSTNDFSMRLCYILRASDLTWGQFAGMSPAPFREAAISDLIDGKIYVAGGAYAVAGTPRPYVVSITL